MGYLMLAAAIVCVPPEKLKALEQASAQQVSYQQSKPTHAETFPRRRP